MKNVYLERKDLDRNMHRFYAMQLSPTLFGEWALIRRWGRIGSQGQKLEQWFASLAEAQIALNKWQAVKEKKGYRKVTIQHVKNLIQHV